MDQLYQDCKILLNERKLQRLKNYVDYWYNQN